MKTKMRDHKTMCELSVRVENDSKKIERERERE